MMNEYAAIRKYKGRGGFDNVRIIACYARKGAKAAQGLYRCGVSYNSESNSIILPDTKETVLLGFEVSHL